MTSKRFTSKRSVTYNLENLSKALRPGISSLVFETYREKLEEKINEVIEGVEQEVLKTLPKSIELKLKEIYNEEDAWGTKLDVHLIFDDKDGKH